MNQVAIFFEINEEKIAEGKTADENLFEPASIKMNFCQVTLIRYLQHK
jgi:hypothetical protein